MALEVNAPCSCRVFQAAFPHSTAASIAEIAPFALVLDDVLEIVPLPILGQVVIQAR